MSTGREQVALLTRGKTIPEPPIHAIHLAVIADAVCAAWEEIVAGSPGTASEEAEPVVNAAIEARLRVALRERTRFSSLVANVIRGAEQHSFDGVSLEKRPDLNFYLKVGDRTFPLSGECKVIDRMDRKGLDKYRSNGVDRFVKGEYAWGTSDAIMVAYVRDASDERTSLATIIGSDPSPWPGLGRTHHRSSHARTFAYVDRSTPPGDIGILHLWLDGGRREEPGS